jgi:hypothetical protein
MVNTKDVLVGKASPGKLFLCFENYTQHCIKKLSARCKKHITIVYHVMKMFSLLEMAMVLTNENVPTWPSTAVKRDNIHARAQQLYVKIKIRSAKNTETCLQEQTTTYNPQHVLRTEKANTALSAETGRKGMNALAA